MCRPFLCGKNESIKSGLAAGADGEAGAFGEFRLAAVEREENLGVEFKSYSDVQDVRRSASKGPRIGFGKCHRSCERAWGNWPPSENAHCQIGPERLQRRIDFEWRQKVSECASLVSRDEFQFAKWGDQEGWLRRFHLLHGLHGIGIGAVERSQKAGIGVGDQ